MATTCTLLCLAACLFALSAAQGIIHGNVHVIDNCTPGDHSTCPAGQCCVKEGMAYIPEYTGPRYSFQVLCRPMGKPGSSCFVSQKYAGMCPCTTGLTCQAGVLGFMGHCH